MLGRMRQRLDAPVTMIAHSMRHAHRKLSGLASQNSLSYLRVRVQVKCRRFASFLGRVVSWGALDATSFISFLFHSSTQCKSRMPIRKSDDKGLPKIPIGVRNMVVLMRHHRPVTGTLR